MIGKPQDFESPYYHLKALNTGVDIMRYSAGRDEVHCYAMKAPGRSIGLLLPSISVCKWRSRTSYKLHDIARGHPMERCEVAGVKGRLVLRICGGKLCISNPLKEVYTNPVFGGLKVSSILSKTEWIICKSDI